jgi:hypothetical protein
VALYVAGELARGDAGAGWMTTGAWISAALVVPTALCLGIAFPLAIGVAGVSRDDVTGRVGLIYAANTAGAVSGSFAAGFLTIPLAGLQTTLQVACVCLITAALAVAAVALTARGRLVALVASGAAVATLVMSPPWDRALMTSGAYLCAVRAAGPRSGRCSRPAASSSTRKAPRRRLRSRRSPARRPSPWTARPTPRTAATC